MHSHHALLLGLLQWDKIFGCLTSWLKGIYTFYCRVVEFPVSNIHSPLHKKWRTETSNILCNCVDFGKYVKFTCKIQFICYGTFAYDQFFKTLFC